MHFKISLLTPLRYTFLLDLALQHNQPLLMVGPTGTGKSVYMNRHLVQGLPKEKWTPIFITMSARTTANMVQDQVGTVFKETHTVCSFQDWNSQRHVCPCCFADAHWL